MNKKPIEDLDTLVKQFAPEPPALSLDHEERVLIAFKLQRRNRVIKQSRMIVGLTWVACSFLFLLNTNILEEDLQKGEPIHQETYVSLFEHDEDFDADELGIYDDWHQLAAHVAEKN